MSSQPVLHDLPFTLEYDSDADVLHIFMDGNEDHSGFITFVSLGNNPDIFLRVNEWDRRCLGISVKPASLRLGSRTPGHDAMRRLADELVARYGQMEPEEISRHQYEASHKLDDDSDITWSYEPFSESLYIDLEEDVSGSDNVEADGYPHLHLRYACDDDRIVGLFMILVAHYLETDMPTHAQLRSLARELVARYAPQT